MCGICGIALGGGGEVDPATLLAMTRAMSHRGPDGDGHYARGGVGLGHRRLSIIDLSGGAQPIYNEDRSVVVVFNGEIYNYRELAQELKARGHRFATESDTEVLVHLYEDLGEGMLDQLRGMFSFALYDVRHDRLLLARDRFGIKPLYYHVRDGDLYFASEIRPLIAAGYVAEPNRQGIHLYLQSRFAHGDETLFRGVYRLAEGSLLDWRRGQWQVRRYYANPVIGGPDDERDFDTLFDEAFGDAVASHMVSDVPVGAYLSGGIDSTAIVARMAQHARKPLHTFCVDFAGSASEAAVAERTARRLGCEHQQLFCGAEELLALPEVVRSLEEPVGDPVIVAQYALSRATRDAGVKVVMTGDGADEILGGYQFLAATIRALRWQRWIPAGLAQALATIAGHVPLPLVQALADLPLGVAAEARNRLAWMIRRLPDATAGEYYDLLLALHRPDELAAAYSPEFFRESGDFAADSFAGTPAGATLADQVLSLQYRKWLPANINLKQDKLAMAHSVETRVPFLDHRLVELAASFPLRVKLDGRRNKILLRQAAQRWDLPAEVVTGRKVPFHLPLGQLVHDKRVRDMVDDNLSPARVRRRGLVNPDYVAFLRKQADAGDYLQGKKLFALVILEIWFRTFIDGEER